MEEISGSPILNVTITHEEYQKWLRGVNFFLVAWADGTDFDIVVHGYKPSGKEDCLVFEGYCDDLHPAPIDIIYPHEDGEDAWKKLEQCYASLLARDARLTISDEGINLKIGENYSSMIRDYEIVGPEFGEGESRGFYEGVFFNEGDAPYMEDDEGLRDYDDEEPPL